MSRILAITRITKKNKTKTYQIQYDIKKEKLVCVNEDQFLKHRKKFDIESRLEVYREKFMWSHDDRMERPLIVSKIDENDNKIWYFVILNYQRL